MIEITVKMLVQDLRTGEQKEVEHGLGTYAWLKEDVISPPFRPFRAQVDTESLIEKLNYSSKLML